MASIAQVTVRFGVDLKEFTSRMQRATREVQMMGRKMKDTGRNLTRGVTLPILAAGAASTKLATDFDRSMTKIQTLVGLSSDTVNGFRAEVLALSGQTARAPEELANALFTVTSAGLRGQAAMDVLTMSAKASAVGMGETMEIAKAITAVMQAYGEENMSAARAGDILTATVREGNLEASELAPVLGRVVGLASQMGVGFDEVGASIATFTRLGVDSAEAVTGLRGLLGGLIKPSNEGRQALASMGMTFDDLRQSIKERGLATTMVELMRAFDGNLEALSAVIPNVRALGTVMGTAGAQADALLKTQDNLANSNNILNESYEETSKSGAFKLTAAFNKLKIVGEDIGNIVLPIVADLADRVKALFDRFNQLDDAAKTQIVQMAAFAAAVGPVIFAVGSLMTGVGGLIKTLRVLSIFLATNPWFALAGAIGAVVMGIVGYNKISGAFAKNTHQASDALKEEQTELNALVGAITDSNTSQEARVALLDELKQKYPDFLKSIDSEKVTNQDLQKALEGVNKEYERKIIQQVAEEETTALLRQQIELRKEEVKLLKEKQDVENKDISSVPSAAYVSPQRMLEAELIGINKRLSDNKKAQQEIQAEYDKQLEFYNGLLPKVNEVAEAEQKRAEVVVNTGRVARESFEAQNAQIKTFTSSLGEHDIAVKGMGVTYEKTFGYAAEATNFVGNAFRSLGHTVSGVFEDMLSGAKVSLGGIVKAVGGLIAKLIAAAAAAAILAILLPGGGGTASAGKALSFGAKFKDMLGNFGGFRANGGPVNFGQSYVVGERGPEIFTPGANGMISPNSTIGGMGQMQVQIVGGARLQWDGRGLQAMISQENIRLKKMGG